MRAKEETSTKELEAEAATLRAALSELEQREKSLGAELEAQQRNAGLRAAALRAENRYIREQAHCREAVATEQIDRLQAEVNNLQGELGRLRGELTGAQDWIAGSPYFRIRHLLGRLLRRR